MSKKSTSTKKDGVSKQVRQKEELKIMKKMDVSHLKSEINSFRDQLKNLIEEKLLIQKQIQKKKEKFNEQSYKIETATKKQQQQLMELQYNLKLLKTSFNEAEGRKKNDNTKEIQDQNNKKDRQLEQLRELEQQLLKKVAYLKNFQEREVKYKQTIQKIEKRHEQIKSNQQKQMEKIKDSFQNQRQQIKQTITSEIKEIKNVQYNKLRQKITSSQQVQRENELLQQQISLCEQQKSIVQKECLLLTEEITTIANDETSLLGNQANQTYERSLRVIKLEGKINKLKQFLNDQNKRLELQAKNLTKNYEENQKAIHQKIEKLQNSILNKQRDYKKVKACSQMVLNQRSSLQCYLLEVFYENPNLSSKEPKDVNQILRKLFIKINSKKTPVTYKNYTQFDMGNSNVTSQQDLAFSKRV